MARRKREEDLTEKQLKLIIGSLLGDGHLVWTTRGYAFRVNHSIKQGKYVLWKYNILKEFVRTSPKECGRCCYFRTISHPLLEKLRGDFYLKNRKILPEKLIEEHLDSFVLSTWFMDDGSRDKNQVRINSQNFSRKENVKLQRILRAKLGIETSLNRDKNHVRIRIGTSSMTRFATLVKPHIIPDMLYKLPP